MVPCQPDNAEKACWYSWREARPVLTLCGNYDDLIHLIIPERSYKDRLLQLLMDSLNTRQREPPSTMTVKFVKLLTAKKLSPQRLHIAHKTGGQRTTEKSVRMPPAPAPAPEFLG